MGNFFEFLSNSQSKELGFDGTKESLKETTAYVNQLDFVGIFEDMIETWDKLHETFLGYGMDWTPESSRSFGFRESEFEEKYDISEEIRKKVSEIQFADVLLYDSEKQKFKYGIRRDYW